MSDPKQAQSPEPKPVDPPAAAPPPISMDPLFRFDTPLFGGNLSGSARELSPGLLLGNTDYLFGNGDRLGGELRLRTLPGLSLEQYAVNGRFGLGDSGRFDFDATASPSVETHRLGTRFEWDRDLRLASDWSRSPDGQVYGADGAFRLGRDGNGTASFRVDEPANTAKFDTRLQFNPDFRLNADWQRTQDGQIYGADGAFRLGREGNGTARFRVDEPAGTTMFDTRLRFDNGFGLNADYTQHRDGAVYGADTTFRLGREGNGSGGFRVDERSGIAALNSRLLFDNGTTLNFDLAKSPQGLTYGGEAGFGLGRDGKGLASFRIDEPNGSAQYKLGASFENGNAFNAQLMSDRLGTSLGLDGRLGFDRGNGSVAFDGKFGPKATDLGAAVNFRNKDLEYSVLARANDASGNFRLSEFGAKIATVGNERYKFSAEAGYRPETRETYGKIGLTISFGGGSKPSRPITRSADPEFEPVTAIDRGIDRAVADLREKQAILLRPDNRTVYEQAVAGVQKLNREGAQLPVQETAASLAVLAKQNGIEIKYVALGKPTADGRQNLFIGDGDPAQPGTRQAFVDKASAATTPMDDSLRRLAGEPARTSAAEAPAQDVVAPSVGRRGG